MKSSKDIQAEIDEKAATFIAITNVCEKDGREMTAEERKEYDAFFGTKDIEGEYPKLKAAKEHAEQREKEIAEVKMQRNAHFAPAMTKHLAENVPGFEERKIPAQARRHGRLKAFESEFDAYASGRFLQASLLGNKDAEEWCQSNGIMAAMSTSDNAAGGFLVPDAFEASIIRLVEEFGVFQRYASVMPMTSDVTNVPRREGGLTVYYPGEGGDITASDATTGNVKLVANKRATLTALSSELSEDSAISIADFLAAEIATAFAKKQDQDGFLGDGTSTYGGVTGLANALAAGSTVDAASGNVSFATFDLADFENVVAKLPVYADNNNTAWFIHKTGYAKSMLRLLDAAGGNTNVTLSEGVRSMPMFLGYPVVFTQAMPAADAVSTFQAYLGDLSMAAHLGVRRGVTVASDSSVYFASDQIGVRATERCAINVHERGDASKPGAIIGLKTAAS
jgi:HK97 family phage major capsid protein